MELETINKLWLELGQITTATSAKEIQLRAVLANANDFCRSIKTLADRKEQNVDWERIRLRLVELLIDQHAVMYPEQHKLD